MSFAHLHVHTEYSLLDGSNKIKDCIRRVKELGMDSIAITDHGVMYGVIDFYRAAKEEGIKPILGCEVYVAPNSRYDKESVEGEERYYHLVLLAENNKGYSNLMKIVSKGFVEGFYYKPRVDMEVLEQYHEGIIALSACLGGEVPSNLLKGLKEEAMEAARKYERCFGKGNFFLELQDHGLDKQRMVNTELLHMSKELEIPLVVTNDIHYTCAEDEKAHDILLCIQTNKKLSDENRMRYDGGQYYIKSEEEMKQLFPFALEALENTYKIAERCCVEIEFGVTKLPKYDVPSEYTSYTYLEFLCREGLEKRYGPPTQEQDFAKLEERLLFELQTIEKMGYVDYFLITWDFINYAKANDILVGPGRGSAAGSLVSYCLTISDIDPIKYDLLFERFLNPERVTMPDIDIDFCYERRQEVIDYVSNKYGADKVVQIVTFGTMASKGAIRDTGRAMDLPYQYVSSVAKMIPNGKNNKPLTIKEALETVHELKATYEEDEQIRYLIDMSMRLEGLPRHASMHASGVVICQQPAEEFVPLSRGTDGSITTQFPMTTIEELGLLKMDFLGLRTLTVIQKTCELVKESKGITVDLDEIDQKDEGVFTLIGSGKTDGVFQIESKGMKEFMVGLKPQNLEDIIAGVSLYRPGPMDFIPQYIEGKNNAHEVTYACKQLEPILEATYGCIVYQEQVMRIVRELGGYTLGRSDLVRRAMSKKKQSVMEEERANFVHGNSELGVTGCVSLGISEKVASEIYDTMMDFAKYAFNKSHAASYAVITYQTAYLKHYYPTEFMAALMTSVISDPKKVSSYIVACRRMGIQIFTPDINIGGLGFSVDGTSIRYALNAIKSIGKQLIEDLVRERNQRGIFTSLKDFITRMQDYNINKKAIENLIKAGALDSLSGNRKQFMSIYMGVVDQIQRERKNALTGQISIFDFLEEESSEEIGDTMLQIGEYEQEFILAFEKEVLGFYISGHPLEQDEEVWKKTITAKTTDFLWEEEESEILLKDKQTVTIGGLITGQTIKYTKYKQPMSFLQIEDLEGTVEVIVFSKLYEKVSHLLQLDDKVFITGRVSLEEEKDGKLLAESVIGFQDLPKKLWIKFATQEEFQQEKSNLMNKLESGGKDQVGLYIEESKQTYALEKHKTIVITEELVQQLVELYGEENVKVV